VAEALHHVDAAPTHIAIEQKAGEPDIGNQKERTRKLETDDYENRARQQERELQEIEQTNQKQWADREKFLADNQAQFEEYQQKVVAMPEELKKAEDEARKKAIEEVSRDAKVKSDLLAKEWEKTKEGYEFKVQSLEQTIQRQNEQIAELSKQLQDTIKQAQELAMRAFASTSNGAYVERAKS
jgi:chromosome segregation ATPase